MDGVQGAVADLTRWLGILGPVVVAVVGVLVARRRGVGPWRTLLLAGLGVLAAVGAMRWVLTLDPLPRGSAAWFGRDVQGYDVWARGRAWFGLLAEVLGLVAVSLLVAAALRERPRG